MQYRRVGKSGLKVSAIGLGTAQCNWWVDEETSHRIFDEFTCQGGNLIDTADVYPFLGNGEGGAAAEEFIGRWLKARGRRNEVILATKVAGRTGKGPNDEGLSSLTIIKAAEESLRRLGVDHIDLYQAHADYMDSPMEETLRAFEALITKGMVRYIGCSNFSAWRLMKALSVSERHNLSSYICIQSQYSLVHRDGWERDLAALCAEEGVGLLPHSPLAKGFLTGRYRNKEDLPSTPRAPGVRKKFFNRRNWKIIAAIDDVATRKGLEFVQVSLAWLLTRPSVAAPIVGVSNVEQLRSVIGSTNVTLDEGDISQLDGASAW